MFLQEYEMTIDRYSYWIYFHYSFGAQGWDIRYSGLKKNTTYWYKKLFQG